MAASACESSADRPSGMDLSPPRTRSTQKRVRGSPTGHTPIQESKRPQTDLTTRKKGWSPEEKTALRQYVKEKDGVPIAEKDFFWKGCAEHIRNITGSSRNAESCRNQYRHLKPLLEQDGCHSPVTGTNISTQTEPAIPILDEKALTYEQLGNFRNSTSTFTQATEDNLHDLLTQRKQHSLSVTDHERALLLNAFLAGDVDDIVTTIYTIPSLKDGLKKRILNDLEFSATAKCVRKESSVLYPKTYDDLKSFKWDLVMTEMCQEQPLLTEMLAAVAVPSGRTDNRKALEAVKPKLGLIYSVLMNSRFHELSRLQRILAVVLKDHHTHEKVFDRLQPLGICSSYEGLANVLDEIGDSCHDQLLTAVKEGKSFRIIGDNINFTVGVSQERIDKHGSQKHWFASAALVSSMNFETLSTEPQGLVKDLPFECIVPGPDDEKRLRFLFKCHLLNIGSNYIDFLKPFAKALPKHDGQFSKAVAQKTLVVPLEVLPYNEQSYAEVVHILDHYEQVVDEVTDSKNTEPVQIGGDQLTRERFTGAKGLRVGSEEGKQRFANLGPITFEMFHLQMNFLTLIFKKLFHQDSFDQGTMNSEKIRIKRNNVSEDVRNHYDQDKDFFLSFTYAYIVEGLCDFFGMSSVDGVPKKNLPPEEEDERDAWMEQVLDKFLDFYVFGETEPMPEEVVTEAVTPVQVSLPNGKIVTLNIKKIEKKTVLKKPQTDFIHQYAVLVMQLGLHFIELLEVCKTPDRERFLSGAKFLMLILKANNKRSKYSLELLRFICHQQATYSMKMAFQSFHALFVNNRGQDNTNIPADLQMEHLVKKTKVMLKSTGPNNKVETLRTRSRCVGAMDAIGINFDQVTKVRTRATLHKQSNADEDEKLIMNDLRGVKPFLHAPGRAYHKFEKITAPIQASLDRAYLESWIEYHKRVLQYEP